MAGDQERLTDRWTRGRSRPGRLRLVDDFLLGETGDLLRRRDGAWARAVVVDVGLGAEPWTTAELERRLAPFDVAVIGVDNDRERVAAAQALAPGLDVRVGSFDLPVAQPVRLVRAMNLLRAYPPEDHGAAVTRMGASLLMDGWLMEGSTCRTGRIAAVNLYRARARGTALEGLLLATDLSAGFAPRMFCGPTPKSAGALLDRWQVSWERTDRLDSDDDRFEQSAVDAGAQRLGRGWAIFSPPW